MRVVSGFEQDWRVDVSERESQIRQVVERVLKLRSSGEEPGREQLLSDHAALMPELGRELDKLDMIHRVVGTANDGLANTQRHQPENMSTIVHGASDRDLTDELVKRLNR